MASRASGCVIPVVPARSSLAARTHVRSPSCGRWKRDAAAILRFKASLLKVEFGKVDDNHNRLEGQDKIGPGKPREYTKT